MSRGRKPRSLKGPNLLLRQEREKRGWSQGRLAELLGADPSMISRWERGERGVDYVYQEKLCTIFGNNAVELGFVAPFPLASSTHHEQSGELFVRDKEIVSNEVSSHNSIVTPSI